MSRVANELKQMTLVYVSLAANAYSKYQKANGRAGSLEKYKTALENIRISLSQWLDIIKKTRDQNIKNTKELEKLNSVLRGLYLPFSEAINTCLGGEYNYNSCVKAGNMRPQI